jgi:DNA modification methylase
MKKPASPLISTKKLSDLTPDARNANKGTARGAAMIRASLRDYGAGRSVLLDRNGAIIAGNKTVENAGALGHKDVIVVQTDGSQLVAVQRTDLDLKDPRARQLAIADNRTSEVSLAWDLDTLKTMAGEGVDLGPFWSDEELARLWPKNVDLLTEDDAVPDTPKEPVSKLGDLWILGDHRLLCGDATSAPAVKDLLVTCKPHLMVTDPPYGVDYDPRWRLNTGLTKIHQKRAEGTAMNDDRSDWTPAWALFPGDVAYVWHSSLHSTIVAESLMERGFQIRSQIIWAKTSLVPGRGNYHWQHEPCWYAVRKGKNGHWVGDRKQSTVWALPKMHRTQGDVDDGKTIHSMQKPVACMERPILNNSLPGDAVYDPFGGSGSTLVACEKTGRKCFMLELDPRYVDVIVERWQNATGKKAVLERG